MPEQDKNISFFALIAFIFASLLFIVSCATAQPARDSAKQSKYNAVAEYSKSKRGLSLVVYEKGKFVFEEYHNGHSANKPHMVASGTKSFSGVLLAAAIEDGLIKNFDEKVSDTITEWKNDRQRSEITLRQLLSLTSGIDAGGIGRPPSYSDAINYSIKYSPGTTFQYGPVPFQIFGEVLKRKLAPKKETVMDYLERRIFKPIGLKVSSWTMQEGQPNLPSGAYLTANEWAKFGRFLAQNGKWENKQIVKKNLLDELVKGSEANPNYGLTFWLNNSSDGSANLAKNERGQRLRRLLNRQPATDEISLKGFGKNIPKDTYVAAGAGNQRLYIIPSRDLVIVRQGKQARFDDEIFLNLLLSGKK